MIRKPRFHHLLTAALLGLTVCSRPVAAQAPEKIELSPVVARLLDDPIADPSRRRAMALFHGQWEKIDQPTVTEQAQIAIYQYDLENTALTDPSVPTAVRAEAAVLRGEPEIAVQLLADDTSAIAAVILAQAFEELGRPADAVAALLPWRERLSREQIEDPVELTAAAQALVMLARLEGSPDQDYALAMSLFAKARTDLDPLYWPAYLAEARLLIEKDNPTEAADALQEALELNPRCGEAWYLLGQLLATNYDFASARQCQNPLNDISPQHLLAQLLEAETFLIQKDPAAAREAVEAALGRYPTHRYLLSQLAAAHALAFDQDSLQATLDHFDSLAPGHPLAHYTVGRFLSLARQYPAAEAMLRTAMERSPNWPKPRIELGLLLMQKGDEAAALNMLRHAARLDPFNHRANNQLKLAQELAEYQEIRTEHFIIRYRAGIDEVLARDMPQQLEDIHARLTAVFGYRPPRPTIIEIMPDERRFAVRITGIPDIWTIAACTGDVIALTPPRGGAHQHGTFDWARVLQHEFIHTVTLNQTDFRIPHWFTEGCAVWQEPGGQSYAECALLAAAFHNKLLLGLDQINWAFVRPRRPHDRELAYAQSRWMVQYIAERFSHTAIVSLLEQFRQGSTNEQAIQTVTGQDARAFMRGFRKWGKTQVEQWGFGAHSEDQQIKDLLSKQEAMSDQELAEWLARYPHHPDLLHAAASRAIKSQPLDQARQAVMRYAAARPVDPWSDRQLAFLSLALGQKDEAVGYLEQLDLHEQETGQWAHQLAQLHREAGRIAAAAQAMRRALHRQPYNPAYRELAATIDLQNDNPASALQHLQALATLEPDRAIHHVRLAAIYSRLRQREAARAAANKARELDPQAPVDKFLAP